MRKIILNLHLFGALIGGIFLIILGGTGGILVFQNDLDRLLNSGLFTAPGDGPVLQLDAIQQSVAKSDPELKPYRFIFPDGPSRPFIAVAGSTQIFINSHTGAIIGKRQMPSPLQLIRQLHTSLLLGDTGRPIVQAATWLSLFLIVSGIYLWWPLRRTGTGRGLSFYLHLTFGIYFAAFLLVLTLTGLVLAYDDTISPLVFSATHSTPPIWNAQSTVIEGATPIKAIDAVRIAQDRLPGAKVYALNLPGKPDGCFRVTMKYRDDVEDEGSSWVLIDRYSGAVLFAQDAHASSPGTRIQMANGTLHTGAIFGLPSKVIMSLSSFVLVAQTITGYLIWWRKLRKPA
jgi:uncharacterized iron-regulated membrane protein